MERRLVVTVDGPAGSGKSTVSRILAEMMSYLYLDTGLLYRAVAWRVRELGISLADGTAVGEACKDITVLDRDGAMGIEVAGEDVSPFLRTEEIGMLASSVSAIPSVRKALLPLQRSAGLRGGIVAEGRDMGTVVFPDADVKFFLDAAVEERARRRHLELIENGKNTDRNAVKRGLEARDHQDTTREIAPLRPADDAVVVDTTGIGIEAVVGKMMTVIQKLTCTSAPPIS